MHVNLTLSVELLLLLSLLADLRVQRSTTVWAFVVSIWESVSTTMTQAHFAVFVQDSFTDNTANKVRTTLSSLVVSYEQVIK